MREKWTKNSVESPSPYHEEDGGGGARDPVGKGEGLETP